MGDVQIKIDVASAEPIFNQLVLQIKQAVSGGELEPGDSLPSIRQLASELGVNSKTVAKAFRLLERDQVIESRGYRGTFVHSGAKVNLHNDIKAWLDEQLRNDIHKYRRQGATDSEIRIAFSNAMLANTVQEK